MRAHVSRPWLENLIASQGGGYSQEHHFQSHQVCQRFLRKINVMNQFILGGIAIENDGHQTDLIHCRRDPLKGTGHLCTEGHGGQQQENP
jgi:hypothetical protein